MKYIYYIIAIFIIFSAIIGYQLVSERVSFKKAALRINDETITIDDFDRLYSTRSSDTVKSDFVNSLITKELLIQESQKEGIDKEESFRRSIQNFYEQSLIKLLMDRKFASLQISVSESDVDKYVSLSKGKLYLTVFSFDNEDEAKKAGAGNGESKKVYLEDLSENLRSSLIPLREGEMTEPVKNGEKFIKIRLDRIEMTPTRVAPVVDREMIKKMLVDAKKEKMINDWIADLKKKSSIKIFLNEKDRGR